MNQALTHRMAIDIWPARLLSDPNGYWGGARQARKCTPNCRTGQIQIVSLWSVWPDLIYYSTSHPIFTVSAPFFLTFSAVLSTSLSISHWCRLWPKYNWSWALIKVVSILSVIWNVPHQFFHANRSMSKDVSSISSSTKAYIVSYFFRAFPRLSVFNTNVLNVNFLVCTIYIYICVCVCVCVLASCLSQGYVGVCVSKVVVSIFVLFCILVPDFVWVGFSYSSLLALWSCLILLFMCGKMINLAHQMFDEKPIWV